MQPSFYGLFFPVFIVPFDRPAEYLVFLLAFQLEDQRIDLRLPLFKDNLTKL